MPETCITFGELGARVMVENKEVQHYAMHVDPVKKEVSCWIASEAGKQFKVVWLEHETHFPMQGRLYLDGRRTRSILRQKKNGNRFPKGPTVFQDVYITDSLVASYLFSPLVVTDDDTFLDSSSSSVGEIKLDINRTATPVVSNRQLVRKGLLQPQMVHERSKKAIAHQVKYGNETNVPRSTKYSAKVIERLVTFIFKYRPLEMLQANEIAPRNLDPLGAQEDTPTLDTPPAPVVTSSEKRKYSKVKKESDSEGESEDEDGKREKALLAEIERIRQARHSKGGERPKKKAKKENKTFFIPGEVIDLT